MMIKVQCNAVTTGNILSRQPKSPGQKGQAWNFPGGPPTMLAPVAPVWANETKHGDFRCTRCGHIGHPEVR